MLALSADKLPTGPQWSYEVKWDGYRCLAVKDGDSVKLVSRNGANLSPRYPMIVTAIASLKAKTVVLDGEIVALDSQGRPSFQALQHAKSALGYTLVYYAFDLLHLNGRDRWKERLKVRRELLRATVVGSHVLLSEPLPGTAEAIERELRPIGLEGIVAKRADSRYEPDRRSGAWQKVKFQPSQDFVIGGFTPDGARVDSLLVGVYRGGSPLLKGSSARPPPPRETASFCATSDCAPGAREPTFGAAVREGFIRKSHGACLTSRRSGEARSPS